MVYNEKGALMVELIWKKEFDIGVAAIDEQHHKMVELINKLEEHTHNYNANGVSEVLEELIAYTQYHFIAEERYMESINYDGLEKHRKIHLSLVDEVLVYADKKNRGVDVDSFELLLFLKEWLIDHILHEDMKLSLSYK